jgi:ribonuclease PH
MNVVVTGKGRLVEVQGTAEGRPFTPAQLGKLVGLATDGAQVLAAAQRATLRGLAIDPGGR